MSSGNLFEVSGPQGSGRGGGPGNQNYGATVGSGSGLAIDQSSSLSNYQKLEKTLQKNVTSTIGRMNSARGKQNLNKQGNGHVSGEIESVFCTEESVENE